MFDLHNSLLQEPGAPAQPPGRHQHPESNLWRAAPEGIEPPQATGPPGHKPGPRKGKPQKAKRKGLPPKGRERGRGFRTLGLGYCLRKAGQAYAGGLVLSSMTSMATAIRMGPMRCWGPRGPHSTTLQRRHPLFSPRDGDCLCRASSGCWPPRNGWETA